MGEIRSKQNPKSSKHLDLKNKLIQTKVHIPKLIADAHGRTFKTLRVSLTNVCNFGCTYCVEGDGIQKENSTLKSASLSEIIAQLHHLLGLQTIRLTGGEPTLYKGLVPLVAELSKLNIPLKMTSNGFLLPKMAKDLANAGLESINISLDAISPVTFEAMARRKGLAQVLDGIDACLQEGIQVKLNSVIMKSLNDQEVLPLFEYARSKQISIRYLELMRMGHLFSNRFDEHFFSQNEILKVISSKYLFSEVNRKESATANYWQTADGFQFGIIANESEPFCHDCDRLRLDSNGNIFGCLSENKSISISELMNDEEMLEKLLHKALLHKQALRFTGSQLTMIGIGG